MAVEVVIKVGVQLLFWVRGWQLNKTKLIQISTQLEVVVEDGKEKVLKINFTGGWVGVAGCLDQLGIKLSHLSTKLKLKLKIEVKDELVAEVG